MEQRKWYYKRGTRYELFNILFDNGRFMMVENAETKAISFGMSNCFNTLYGFPVNWSCLTKEQAGDVLRALIAIDEKYPELRQLELEQFGYTQIDQWKHMIDALSGSFQCPTY